MYLVEAVTLTRTKAVTVAPYFPIRALILLTTVQLHFQQKPTTIGLIKCKHSTRAKDTTSLTRTDGKFPNPWGNTRRPSTYLPPSLLKLTQETLDSLNVLILFSNNRNKQKNSSTRCIRLKHVTNCRELASKSWMERCSPHPLGF